MKNLSAVDRKAGFTLLEMLIVLSIMALVVTIAVPGIRSSHRERGVDGLTDELVARLRWARTLAISGIGIQNVTFNPRRNRIEFADGQVIELPNDVSMSVTIGRETLTADRVAILTFLPNGSSSGAEIELERNGHEAVIKVNWLSGLTLWSSRR